MRSIRTVRRKLNPTGFVCRLGHYGLCCNRRRIYRQDTAERLGCFPILLLVLLLFWATFVQEAEAQTGRDRDTEYKVKVAYIYNFCRYIEWPEGAFGDPRAPLEIGVLGVDPFGPALDALANRKTVKGRKIAIERFASGEDFQVVHVLFVGRSTDSRLRRWALEQAQGKPILVIGESDGFAEQGAAVNFYHDSDATVGFEINVDVTARQRLHVSAKLLKLATIVRDGDRP